MALSLGSRLGPYEVISLLGAGGMGEVFRARDSRLNRDVALKTLPQPFAADQERLARFEREAQVLASLNHPNIGSIYGIEENALVLELVEGLTLADVVARGPMPLDEALAIARQIAHALAAAHEHGIVHRDLKPGNVKVKSDGTVKVLDFGLAKAVEAGGTTHAGGNPGVTHSPTITSPALMTGTGVILGTAAYMSPEQARGKPVDRRADIWAFGCVLYEMLTGTRAFAGDDVSETLAAVIKGEPDWRALPHATPAPIRRLLRRCLTKDPTSRLSDALTARLEIDEALAGSPADEQPARQASPGRERIALLSALVVVTLIAAGAVVWALRPLPAEPEMRLEIATPPTTDPISLAISRDGQKLAFVATVDGRPTLWVRSLDSVESRPLANTEGARFPFWSPDSLSIGFFADGQLKRVDINGGPVQVLTKSLNGAGATWGDDGTILFNGLDGAGPILRTTAAGSEPVEVTKRVLPQQTGHRFPSFLPDGHHFVYYVGGMAEARGVYLGATDGSLARRLFDSESSAVYHSSGHLLFIRQGTLVAQAFDPVLLTVTGNPFPVVDDVAVTESSEAALAASDGRIVLRRGLRGGQHRQLAWFDRSGGEISAVGPPETNGGFPSLSPAGDRIVMQRQASGTSRSLDIWLLDIKRNILSPLVTSPAVDAAPLWSKDGNRIVFTSARGATPALYVRSVRSTASEELVFTSQGAIIAADWSRDGQFLLYLAQDPKTGWDLMALPMTGDERKPRSIARTEADERGGQFSPNGGWVAYQSNESGRDEVWVQSFPDGAIKERVSADGGGQVRWRRDGRELFYLGLDDRLMAVPIALDPSGETIRLGTPVPLFRAPLTGEAAPVGLTRQPYEVSPDGQRFLINKEVEEVVTTPITIILNWKPKS